MRSYLSKSSPSFEAMLAESRRRINKPDLADSLSPTDYGLNRKRQQTIDWEIITEID